MLDVHPVNTGTDFVTSSDSKLYGFDRIRRPHDIGFISYSKVSGERIQIFSDTVVGFTGNVWTEGAFAKKVCGFKCIRIRVDGA